MSGLATRRRRSDIVVPPECGELVQRGALVAVNHSGGKDSQCMTILLSRLVPREQLLVVHAPLGEVEWPDTLALIEATIPDGVPLILAPVTSGKSLLQSIEERGQFPSAPAKRGKRRRYSGSVSGSGGAIGRCSRCEPPMSSR